jgi:hypothetical protein
VLVLHNLDFIRGKIFCVCQWVPLKVVEEFQDRYGDGHSGSDRFVGGVVKQGDTSPTYP